MTEILTSASDGYYKSWVPTYKFALRQDLEDSGDLFLPKQAEPLSTGYDVRAAQHDRRTMVLYPGQYFKIPLGFRTYCPSGWWYQLHPRSSSFTKKHMHNLIGTVDESWEGETLFAGQFIAETLSRETSLEIQFGEPIGQLIPCKRQLMVVEKISNEECDRLYQERDGVRKTGGFGSTSK